MKWLSLLVQIFAVRFIYLFSELFLETLFAGTGAFVQEGMMGVIMSAEVLIHSDKSIDEAIIEK